MLSMFPDTDLGTKEIESAALTAPEVAEAAVVPVRHEVKGKEPDLYISLKPGLKASAQLAKDISNAIVREIGRYCKAEEGLDCA